MRLVQTIFNVSPSNLITLINMIFPYFFPCFGIIIQRIKINLLKFYLRDMVIFWNWDINIFWNWNIFSEIGTSTFSRIKEWIISRIETLTFSWIGIATLVVGNTTLTSKEFDYFRLKKIKYCSWFSYDLQIK